MRCATFKDWGMGMCTFVSVALYCLKIELPRGMYNFRQLFNLLVVAMLQTTDAAHETSYNQG